MPHSTPEEFGWEDNAWPTRRLCKGLGCLRRTVSFRIYLSFRATCAGGVAILLHLVARRINKSHPRPTNQSHDKQGWNTEPFINARQLEFSSSSFRNHCGPNFRNAKATGSAWLLPRDTVSILSALPHSVESLRKRRSPLKWTEQKSYCSLIFKTFYRFILEHIEPADKQEGGNKNKPWARPSEITTDGILVSFADIFGFFMYSIFKNRG